MSQTFLFVCLYILKVHGSYGFNQFPFVFLCVYVCVKTWLISFDPCIHSSSELPLHLNKSRIFYSFFHKRKAFIMRAQVEFRWLTIQLFKRCFSISDSSWLKKKKKKVKWISFSIFSFLFYVAEVYVQIIKMNESSVPA